MGGSWDATNVADGAVAVVLPIAVDHTRYLGDSPAEIAIEKAGIIKPGAVAVLAEQQPDVAEVLLARASEVGASVLREGLDFGVVSRVPAVGGQVVSLQGLRGRYDELFLPLYGAHQAQNAAIALAAVEAFVGGSETAGRRAGAGGVRAGHLAGPARDRAHRSDDPARRRAQPARRRGGRGGARGLVHPRPADRRDRRDGGQGRRGAAGGVRASPRPRRVHPELHRARDAGRRARDGRRARSTARTGSPSSRGWQTPSTWRPGWPRPSRARPSGPAAC